MSLYFKKMGDGPPLVIVHGLYGSSDNWISIARSLSSHYTIYIPDMRNHGRSPHSEVHTYEAMSADIEEFAASEFPGRKFILAGHSMGGKVAMLFAMRNPELVNALVVIDISPFGDIGQESSVSGFHLRLLKAIISCRPGKADVRDDIAVYMDDVTGSSRTTKFILKNLYRTEEGRLAWRLNAQALHDNLENLMGGIAERGRVTGPVTGFPVLFIRGGLSDYMPVEDIDESRKLFPSLTIRTIEDAGHWLHSEKPEELINAIGEFLECNC